MGYKLLSFIINTINWLGFKEKTVMKPLGVVIYYIMMLLSAISVTFLISIQ